MKIVKASPKGWGDPWQEMGHSKNWSKGPLIGLDTETTSADPKTARIVTSAIVLDDPFTNTTHEWKWVSNPGIPIDLEAIAIHGINDDYVKDHGRDPDIVIREILSILNALYH